MSLFSYHLLTEASWSQSHTPCSWSLFVLSFFTFSSIALTAAQSYTICLSSFLFSMSPQGCQVQEVRDRDCLIPFYKPTPWNSAWHRVGGQQYLWNEGIHCSLFPLRFDSSILVLTEGTDNITISILRADTMSHPSLNFPLCLHIKRMKEWMSE